MVCGLFCQLLGFSIFVSFSQLSVEALRKKFIFLAVVFIIKQRPVVVDGYTHDFLCKNLHHEQRLKCILRLMVQVN